MSLGRYKEKRDFKKTKEPKGAVSHGSHHIFVIQKHAASHLHYDFRLELNGVLLSWAVPKGPCLDPGIKRLAMHVEDHPVDYAHFEGIIPKGEYGGGTVMLWDRGYWEPLQKDPEAAYKKGHLSFILHAEKLNGQWDLFRFKDDKHWLLVKHKDEFSQQLSDGDITIAKPYSVLSNQSLEEIAKHDEKIWQTEKVRKLSNKKALKKPIQLKFLNKSIMPDFIPPQLPTLVDSAPLGRQWTHEIKYDGYRILAFINNKSIILKSRNNKIWNTRLIPIEEALKALPIKKAILDGEIILLNKDGKSSFQLLQNRMKAHQREATLIYYIFDILYYEGYDLTSLPLKDRKNILKNLLKCGPSLLRYSEGLDQPGDDVFQSACELGLEGIVSKDSQSPYISHRSKGWLKIKCMKRQEFVIGGFSPPKGNRSYFGSLYLGVFNEKGNLDYVGNVGTGFSDLSLQEIYQVLKSKLSSQNPFTSKPPGITTAQWVNPVMVAEVEFSEWTDNGSLRHPSFKGLRLDKKAEDVMRERELPIEKVIRSEQSKAKKSAVIRLTNPNKILYGEDGISKKDLLYYYESVADKILPFIKNRPLSLLRCPTSYQECFFQRHFNRGTPKTLKAIDVENKKDKNIEQYIYLNDTKGLLSLVQMGVLEIHPWGSNIEHIDKPDVVIFDLDPAPNVAWKEVVAAAFEIKKELKNYPLDSFVKTTGGNGLHVLIPIKAEYGWEEVKKFTFVFVQYLEKIKPEKYISTMSKSKRSGKIFIDYLRNQHGATAISAYSTRARIHAPVSVPLSWEELSEVKRNNIFTIKNIAQHLSSLKKDPWPGFWTLKQSLKLDQLL